MMVPKSWTPTILTTSKQGNPIIGLNLVNGFVYQGKNKWGDGTIYDPDNGKTYSCKMTLMEDNTLKVRGFIGISLIGRTQVWGAQINSLRDLIERGVAAQF